LAHTSNYTSVLIQPAPRPGTKSQNGRISSFVALKKNYLLLKRAFDLVFSSLVIVTLLSWLTPLLAALIKLSSPGPVFFLQKRIGLNGRPYTCIKFRTMICNDEADLRPATLDDDRITRVGRALRLTNLDELPQFINVFLGQMSVVGPRPHMPTDCNRFTFVIPSYPFRHLVKPGITGWAQVNGFHGVTANYESIALRYYWDAQYVRRAGFVLDLSIIGKTVRLSLVNLKLLFRSNNQQQYCKRL
jgi:putative colanic acid biosynthesis UDP-glucose lipid carrier transferase